jgi:hypothetical protein
MQACPSGRPYGLVVSRTRIEERAGKGELGVHSTSKHALLRVVVAMTVAAVVAVAWAGSALAGTDTKGTLELCKSSLNGMSGRTFSYTLTPKGGSAASVTVKGGRCSGPIQIAGGEVTILEQQSDPATDVATVRATPSARLLSTDLAARKAVVNVPAGSTVASETRVTFVNQPAGGNFGDLKICKLTETEAFLGKQFSFKVNGGPAISVEASDAWADPATWSCRLAGHFQVGSLVKVQELIPSEAQVAWIDTDPMSALVEDDNYSTSAGTATVRIGTGATVVMYDNEPFVPQGNGYIEVCKDRALLDYNTYDWAVQGNFHFTIQDQLGVKYERDVVAGQCTEPIQVAAGIATVTEGASNYELVDVWTLPEDRLQTSNLINRTATVEIPVSNDQNDETQVHFVNKTPRAQLKICKALGPYSSALENKPFFFDVDTGNHYESRDLFKITSGSTTQCKIWGDVPVGTDVEVNEVFAKDAVALNTLTKLEELPSDDFIDVSGEGTITIKPGINTITITNTAMGQLEICKARIQYLDKDALRDDAQPFFNFTVDGSKKVQVRAGRCAPPLRVNVGNHTVVESSYNKAVNNAPTSASYAISMSSAASDYELDQGGTLNLLGVPYPYTTPGNGIDVSPSDRVISKNLSSRTVTVSVPYGANGETLVTYYNRIRKGRIKICKQIPDTSSDSLGGKDFNFKWEIDHKSGTVTLKPGECTYVIGDFNIIDSSANPVQVKVTETTQGLNTTFVVSDINVQFGRPLLATQPLGPGIYTDLKSGVASWNLGPDTNVVTYTNKSIDP